MDVREPRLRRLQARHVYTVIAVALIVIGGWLRLRDMPAVEFKLDEQKALALAREIGLARSTWPTHGMMGSGGVANAPLYSWIIAAFRAWDPGPLAVTAWIGIINTLCLWPLWRWARGRLDDTRALLVLAAMSVSPFAVLYSRKIWAPNLLLPALVLLLFAVDWLRSGRLWRAATAFGGVVLVAGQLHQSAPIALLLMPVAIVVQWWIDGRPVAHWRVPRPTIGEAIALVIAIAANAFFWLPYFDYLREVPLRAFTEHVRTDTMRPFLLGHVISQITGADLFLSFEWDRAEFFGGAGRSFSMYAVKYLGWPLAAYGTWRWLRAPASLPVVGIWWALVVIAFMLMRIPIHSYYALTLAPLPAVLVAGAFDPPSMRDSITRMLTAWRVAYIGAMFALTLLTQLWISERGGATPDYGMTYAVRAGQARALVALSTGAPPDPRAFRHRMSTATDPPMHCDPPPTELVWLARSLGPAELQIPATLGLCERWIREGPGLKYEWQVEAR